MRRRIIDYSGNDGELFVMRPDYTLQIARKAGDGTEPRVSHTQARSFVGRQNIGQPHERHSSVLNGLMARHRDSVLMSRFCL